LHTDLQYSSKLPISFDLKLVVDMPPLVARAAGVESVKLVAAELMRVPECQGTWKAAVSVWVCTSKDYSATLWLFSQPIWCRSYYFKHQAAKYSCTLKNRVMHKVIQ